MLKTAGKEKVSSGQGMTDIFSSFLDQGATAPPKNLKKYRVNDGIVPLPSPLALNLQSKMSVDITEK